MLEESFGLVLELELEWRAGAETVVEDEDKARWGMKRSVCEKREGGQRRKKGRGNEGGGGWKEGELTVEAEEAFFLESNPLPSPEIQSLSDTFIPPMA